MTTVRGYRRLLEIHGLFLVQTRFAKKWESRHGLKITLRVRVVICVQSFIKLQFTPTRSSGCWVTQTQVGKIPK